VCRLVNCREKIRIIFPPCEILKVSSKSSLRRLVLDVDDFDLCSMSMYVNSANVFIICLLFFNFVANLYAYCCVIYVERGHRCIKFAEVPCPVISKQFMNYFDLAFTNFAI